MITVRLFMLNGTEDIKDVWSLDELCLDGVREFKVIRDERKKVA